jgi:class 3 adenylate cyclase/tetratricopeptide (TPR) repeat protein
LVSVLFADLVGFTTLSEQRDSEDVRDLLSRYFELARQVIARYGGVVEKFIGDAVMAVWGTPVTNEDDAERAVRAALELTEAIEALGEHVGAPDLRARAGVLTGEAAVNLDADGQGMVAGDLVNTASRVQAAAEPGSVFVGEATRRASEAAIDYEDAGTFELKGKAEPMSLWRAERVVAAIGGGQRAAGLEPPFVGRDRELRTIKDLFHETADGGSARLVSVVGPAGIGKSRLVWEFFKYIDGLADDTRWHRGRCLAYGEGVTYWALAEMVRTNANILEGEETASAMPKLRVAVEHAVTDPEERKWVEPRLASLLGLESGPTRDREDLFAAWRLFYERLSAEMPTVMVFEDIQWADASLLDFIEYLIEWSRDHRIFVLTLARPELTERRPGWGADKRSVSSIYLNPLPQGSMDELLTGLVPGLPGELSSRVLERAEGVPLYAVETVRMLLDRGLVVEDAGAYRPTGAVGELEVPETLHGLIAARLDGLTADERRLAQDASVLGKTFVKDALARVSGLPIETLEPLLSSLMRKEILSVQADPNSPERGQYAFLGDLIRWVAYETLSKKERRTRHVAAAAFLESNFEEEDVAEVVASHYLQAYETAPDAEDSIEIRAKARDALARAGHRAASVGASREALRYYERAADLADQPLIEAELQERAGDVAWTSTDSDAARRHYERAIELYSSVGQTHPTARVSAAYAEVRWATEGGNDEALERMERAFEVLSAEEPDDAFAMLAAQLGRFLFFAGRTEEAHERTELALRLAEGLQLPEVYSQALNTRSLVISADGRPDEALVLLNHALEVALDHDLGAAALRAYNNLCATYGYANRHEQELESARAGVELARRLGNERWELQLLACELNPLMNLGRWDEAVALAADVERRSESGGATLFQEFLLMLPIHLARGDRDAAARLVDQTRASIVGDSSDVQMQSGLAAAEAIVRLADGDRDGAFETASVAVEYLLGYGGGGAQMDAVVASLEAGAEAGDARADELASRIERILPGALAPSIRVQMVRYRARRAAAQGRPAEAETGFKQAVGAFRELLLPFPMAVTLTEHAEWLVAQGRVADAQPLLAEAREIFQRLRATPWQERVDAALPAAVSATS